MFNQRSMYLVRKDYRTKNISTTNFDRDEIYLNLNNLTTSLSGLWLCRLMKNYFDFKTAPLMQFEEDRLSRFGTPRTRNETPRMLQPSAGVLGAQRQLPKVRSMLVQKKGQFPEILIAAYVGPTKLAIFSCLICTM